MLWLSLMSIAITVTINAQHGNMCVHRYTTMGKVPHPCRRRSRVGRHGPSRGPFLRSLVAPRKKMRLGQITISQVYDLSDVPW